MNAARRAFLAQSGGIAIAFTLPLAPRPAQAQVVGAAVEERVDAWLRIGSDGRVAVQFGKVEIGTGIATAIAQIVADELDVAVGAVAVGDQNTVDTPDQGYTAGSASLQVGAVPVRRAAAEARAALLDLAAARFGVAAGALETRDGAVVVRGKPQQRATYAALAGGSPLGRRIGPGSAAVKPPAAYRVVGTSLARVDLPAKTNGTFRYIGDVRVPGMLHGRVVRPPAIGAALSAVDETSVQGIPGLVQVVRRGNFLGVVTQTEWAAVQAAARLRAAWIGGGLAEIADLGAAVQATPVAATRTLANTGDTTFDAPTLAATYVWPYQSHGSIGPGCGIADVRDGSVQIWSATQGIHPLRGAIAQLLGVPLATVRVSYVEGAGCYGHNGADDAAADAALLSQAVGRPVRVQWMRHDEHGWDPKGPATVQSLAAKLDARGSRIAAWRTEVWSPSHSTRPGGRAGNTIAGRLSNATAAPLQFTGGDRNAKVDYDLGAYRVAIHDLTGGLVVSSAFRGLGGTQNTFANESFIDELAAAAAADPLEFRLRHLSDPRAIAVLQAVARLAVWTPRSSGRRAPTAADPAAHGRGVAFVRYENTDAYVATVADVVVDRTTGAVRCERIAVAHDCGLVINPDGLRNQIEGNAIQGLSRALKEAVTFDRSGVASRDWRSYPILRFSEVPDVHIALLDRPDQPVLGAGEATTTTIAPAVANAIFDACGMRLRQVPFTPARVLAALRTA